LAFSFGPRAGKSREMSRSVSGDTPAATCMKRLGPWEVILLSAWCGAAGGLLEVAARVLCRMINPTNRLYMMTRHFVWLAPLSNLLLFSLAGTLLAMVAKRWPQSGAWLVTRIICIGAIFPTLVVISPQIYELAWVILAAGMAIRLAPRLEKGTRQLRRWLPLSFALLLGVILGTACLVFGGDWLKARHEASLPLPTGGAPNVLLVVMDTVRADRLSLYGYERPTTPTLERLARRGIRFDNARATAPWTLPSHASIFTGRWPHELGVKWLTPLKMGFPTLAEYLGKHGYATAGFVGNRLFCSYDSGLDRGFTRYEDYVLGPLTPFRTAWLVDRGLSLASDLGLLLSRTLGSESFRSIQAAVFEPLFTMDRKKDAAIVNQEFLDWISRRRESGRPFFAFLNYFDAHSPYVLPPGAMYQFGLKPQGQADFSLLVEHWGKIDKMKLSHHYRALARDCYDNCLLYMDEKLGQLLRELERREILDRTLLIVASDHGEGLGEHDLFDHGESLYSTEIHVPLLFVLPAPSDHSRVVSEPVSLRDLPATVVDLVGLASNSPFPGRSLAVLWRSSSQAADSMISNDVFSELPAANPSNPNQGRSPAARGPLISLAQGDYVYIRNQQDGREELFLETDDRRELSNRAGLQSLRPILEQFRRQLSQLQANGPRGAVPRVVLGHSP
jgi:arylsulfatase A-like enzyme